MKQDSAETATAPQRSLAAPKNPGDRFWYLALAAVLLILLHESLFMGKGLVPADGVLNAPPWNQTAPPSNFLLMDQYRVFVPEQEFVHQQKTLPLWNPDICCGVPNLGAIQGATFFPVRLLLSSLDPFSASGPAAFLKLCLAGWFMLLYARLLGVSGAGAFLAGIVFSLSGFMIVWLGHPHVNCAMWLPLLFYLVEKQFRCEPGQAAGAKNLRLWAGFAIVFACMILGGHPPTAIHMAIFVGIYFMVRLMERGCEERLARTGLLIAAIAAGLLLAAPQILPFLEYNRESSSAAASAVLNRWSSHLNPSSLIHFLLPNVFGNSSRGPGDLETLLGWHAGDNFNERTGYVGILPLFFAVYAMCFRRCRFTFIFAAFALGSLLVIFGVPPLLEIIRMLPVLHDANQTRLLLIVGFSAAMLAALGWDTFFEGKNQRRAVVFVTGFCVVIAAVVFWFWWAIAPGLAGLDGSHQSFLTHQFLVLAIGVLVVIALVLLPAARMGRWPLAMGVTWTIVDLLLFAGGYNPAISWDMYYPRTPGIEWLQKEKSLCRIFGDGSVLPPNTAEAFGLSDARGCDYMTVRRYEELITGKAGSFFFYENPPSIPNAFALLNVKYILSAGELPSYPTLELVYSNEMFIYRVNGALDRALLVYDSQVEPDKQTVLARVMEPGFDPRKVLYLEQQPVAPRDIVNRETYTEGSVKITSYEPDAIRLEATLPKPGYLVLLDTYFPGWSARVNGDPAPIYRADYNFRAVSLPAGKSVISFSYFPGSLKVGVVLCGIGLVVVGGVFFVPRIRRKRSSHII